MKITRHAGVVELALDGRFDAHEVGVFRASVGDVRDVGGVLRIDLSGVGFIDSSALAELLALRKDVQAAGGTLLLAPVSDPVRVILELTGLQSVFAPDPVGNGTTAELS